MQEIVKEFRKSSIQSEAEVRTKLIIPLLHFLGYPSHLRAEEYPVFGFEGSKKLPTKNADFIMFSDPSFSKYRFASSACITWVHNHSLLVVEAKKTDEMPEVLGQPQYYTVWTRALAYFVTDGVKIRGCIYQPITSDYEVVTCLVDDLPANDAFLLFSYDNLLSTKIRYNRQVGEITNAVLEVKNDLLIKSDLYTGAERVILPSEELYIPSEALSHMKSALGQNAVGLSNYAIAKRYLSMTDSYLQNDIRYGAPDYMIHVPRRIVRASLHINENIIPKVEGNMTIYYQDHKEKYDFASENFTLCLAYENEELVYCESGYMCTNTNAEKRLIELNNVLEIIESKKISIWVDDSNKVLHVDKSIINSLRKDLSEIHYWIEEINKIKSLQEYYKIRFYLGKLEKGEETTDLYRNVDIVYNGITMQTNVISEINRTVLEEDVRISEPLKIDLPPENKDVMRITIHNYVFVPNEVFLLPISILQKGKKKRQLEFCVTFVAQEKKPISD